VIHELLHAKHDAVLIVLLVVERVMLKRRARKRIGRERDGVRHANDGPGRNVSRGEHPAPFSRTFSHDYQFSLGHVSTFIEGVPVLGPRAI
jgi:hypothetical protein